MKRVMKVWVFILVGVLIFLPLTHVFLWKSSADVDTYNCEHFYNTPDDTIDVLFVGSSHCFCTVNNSVLWENYGIAGYNFSTACQNLGNTYYYLKEAFKTQSPKVVCVESYYFNKTGYSNTGDVYRNTLGLKYSKNYIDNAKFTLEAYGKEGITLADLIFKWPIIHSRYSELSELDYNDYLYFQRGYRAAYENSVCAQPFTEEFTEVADVDEEAYEWVDKIIELVEENDAEIMFFAAPYILSQEKMAEFNALEQYLENKNITFINFNTYENIAGLNYETDLWHEQHLNYYGAEKVSNYLGNYLNETYEFESHDGDERYELWDLDLLYYKNNEGA